MKPSHTALSSFTHANRGIAMPPSHTAVSSFTHANRGIAMQTSTLSTLSPVSTIKGERPSGLRLRAERPVAPAARPTELHASQVDAVARREIEWFFTSAATDAASDGARARIYAWIHTLGRPEQETLALRYDPMPCPTSLEEHWGDGGFALGLSLAFAGPWRPYGRPRHSLEREASDQLEEAVKQHGPGVLDHIKCRAEWDLAAALGAYADARGRVPSVIPAER